MTTADSVASLPGGLLEREELLASLQRALADAISGAGRMVLVAGDPGVGKTALARALVDAPSSPGRVLWGACDPLSTPRPLGPFADLAVACTALRSVISRPCGAHEVFAAFRDDVLDAPSVLVIEDAHWADQASLDVLRLLGRRITSLPVLALVTYRDEPSAGVGALRIALGDLAGAAGVSRLALGPLSRKAVEAMAADTGVDPDELYRRTAGNPFFVTEVLRTGDGLVPPTVRDAVLARVAHLGTEDPLPLEIIASTPPAAESWLLDAICGDCAAAIDAGVAAGMLVTLGDAIGFRHEIAREVVERGIAQPHRREVHRRILSALAAAPDQDPARLAHHAEGAGDIEAVVAFARLAAERATAVSAHREAAAQYGRAARAAGGGPVASRAALLELRAEALYAADEQVESIADLHEAAALYRLAGKVGREADAMRRLVPRLTCRGQKEAAREAAATAVGLLSANPAAREYAGALLALAHLHLCDNDFDSAIAEARRAGTIAAAFDDSENVIDAALTAGAAEVFRDGPAHSQALEALLAPAHAEGDGPHVPEVLSVLAWAAVEHHAPLEAERWIEEGLAYTEGHDLDLWRLLLLAARAWVDVHRARWDDAADTAASLVAELRDSPGPRAEGFLVLSLVRARNGEPGAADALAAAAAIPSAEATWPVRLASAEAEIDWLAGRAARIGRATEAAFAAAARQSSPWPFARLAVWRLRAGLDISPTRQLPDPIALEFEGRHREAAEAWDRRGCPYDAAVALSLADDVGAIADAHERLLAMGAQPAAAAAARRLRERGIRGLPRGPHRSTRQNPAQLTRRELDVLALVVDGLTNAEIAQRLFVSPRTVDHHVSAILRKLAVPTRARAIAAAVAGDLTSAPQGAALSASTTS